MPIEPLAKTREAKTLTAITPTRATRSKTTVTTTGPIETTTAKTIATAIAQKIAILAIQRKTENSSKTGTLPNVQMFLSVIIPNDITDYLQVQIYISQIPSPATTLVTALTVATATPTAKKTRAKRKRTKTKIAAIETGPHPNPPPAMDPNDGMAALAQIDTGCQVGDVINRRVLRGLRGEPQLRTTDSSI